MRKVKCLFLALLLAIVNIQYAYTAEKPIRNASDKRNAVINHRSGTIWEINTAQGYNTTLVFNDNEIVQAVIIGTENLWSVQNGNNVVYIKPIPFKQENDGNTRIVTPRNSLWTTNMTVVTNKGRYLFELNVVDARKEVVDFEVVVKRYIPPAPKPKPKPVLTAKQKAAIEAKALEAKQKAEILKKQEEQKKLVEEAIKREKSLVNALPMPVNWNYTQQTSDNNISDIEPYFIYDDNKNIYIGFSATKQIPQAYGIVNDKEKLIQSKVINNGDGTNTIVVYGLYKGIVLRYDNLVIRYNKNNKVEY